MYDPADWNDGDGIQFSNNCYNYSTTIRTDTFAQPGRAHGQMYSALTCSEVTRGALADGLVLGPAADGPANAPCPRCSHKVALVMAPGWDYHWYRMDANGAWSHKPGRTPARNLDNSGQIITDPRTADRGPYTQFCGFFCVCKLDVTIN